MSTQTTELEERVELIERMLLEGRRAIERWSWVFVMWGVAHALGVLASFALPSRWVGMAWGILMGTCGVVMGVAAGRTLKARRVETQVGRSLSAVWLAFALVALFLCRIAPSESGHLPTWCGLFAAAYGAAFFAGGHIVRWLPMKLNGLLWWSAALTMSFLGARGTLVLFGGMAVIGEVGFGLYALAQERKVLAGDR